MGEALDLLVSTFLPNLPSPKRLAYAEALVQARYVQAGKFFGRREPIVLIAVPLFH
jgi:hypothetical protein